MPGKQATDYCFTNYVVTEEPVFVESQMEYLVFGLEVCPETGNYHYQCFVQFFNKKTYNAGRKFFPGTATNAFKERYKGSTPQQAADYCKKDGQWKEFGTLRTSKQGQRTDLTMVSNRILAGEALKDLMIDEECMETIARHMQYFQTIANDYRTGAGLSALKARLAGITLRPWQQGIADLVDNDPDPRHVYWYWSEGGAVGKTTIADYLLAFKGAALFTHGKVSDIAHAYNLEPVVIFDLARSQEDKLDGVYMCLENFKNGRFFSPKYNSTTKLFPPTHVFVFANFPPDTAKLSQDRWKIVKLD